MRIISGRFRGRKLLVNPGQTTRPITDRAKEFLFEHLRRDMEGQRVLDAFAGTGSLGLESLSHGAAGVVFIEQDRQAFERLQRNVAALGVQEECLCWRTDALRSSFRPRGVDHLLPYTLVFFDPPYRMVEQLRPESLLFAALRRVARDTVSAADCRLILRAPERIRPELPPVWQPEKRLEFSTMQFLFYRKQPSET